jgi:hypothetical protein
MTRGKWSVIQDSDPLLMADVAIWPRVLHAGYFLLVVGLLLAGAIIALGIPDGISLIPIVAGLLLALMGLHMVRGVYRARAHKVSFALTRDAIWRRVTPDTWKPFVPLSQVRRLEAGTDNIRYAGEMHAGATLLLVDDQHATYEVGPLPDPMSWVESITALCADHGVPLETYVQPWVPKYNPPEASGSVTEQALQPDASRSVH